MKFVALCGLPRSGSTLLGNVLNQHPDITSEMDSCLADILINISQHSEKVYTEDAQHTIKEMDDLYYTFMRSGIVSWITKLCKTDIYLDKNRTWSMDFNLLFNLIPSAKVIFLVRDLRGVISSLEKIDSYKRLMPSEEIDFQSKDEFHNVDILDAKIKNYMQMDMINVPLFGIKEALDCERGYLKNFKFITYEDFMENPHKILNEIYNFIGIKNFDNDLENITQGYYHDAVFAPFGDHTIRPQLTPQKENYNFPLIKRKSQLNILNDYSWFYQQFYPRIYRESIGR